MDKSISSALEIGVAFVLLIVGLTQFVQLHTSIMTFSQESKGTMVAESQVNIVQGESTEKLLSKADVYYLLTEGSLLGQTNWLDKKAYRDADSGIEVYMDGSLFPVVLDYEGKQSLKSALLALPGELFQESYHVDKDGKLQEIHLTTVNK